MNIKLKRFFLNPFNLLLTAWGILNLLQARFTTLNNDEAYYWMYSKNLAWGYLIILHDRINDQNRVFFLSQRTGSKAYCCIEPVTCFLDNMAAYQ